MHTRAWVLLAVVALATPLVAGQDASRAVADRADQKVQAILARGLAPGTSAPAVTTSFTEDEVNAYLRAQEDMPTGLMQPTVRLLDAGRLDVRALVDLDVVRRSEERGWLDPLAYVTGVLEVHTIGVFRGAKGLGVYTFESARVGGAPVPRAVLQEILALYTRSPETPNGVQLDTPFELPARIREVELRRGLATVIQ